MYVGIYVCMYISYFQTLHSHVDFQAFPNVRSIFQVFDFQLKIF